MENISSRQNFSNFRSFRDLMRSPFTNKFNWLWKISDSGLSPEVKATIFKVVSKTRLMRFEKSEATDELVAHFQGGLERGQSLTELILLFGDPLVAAKLIRGSKKMKRPLIAKCFRSSIWIGCFCLAGYLCLSILFYSGMPNPTVDYLQPINATVPQVAESDQAWPIYRDAWTNCDFCEGRNSGFLEIYCQYRNELRLVVPSDGKPWEFAKTKLESSSELIEALRHGGRKPVLGLRLQTRCEDYSPEDFAALFPMATNEAGYGDPNDVAYDSLFSITLPHVQTFRKAARILHVDTRWALEQGDIERTTRNLEAIFGIASQVSEYPFMVCALVAIAIHGIGCDVFSEILETYPDQFNDEQLVRMKRALSRRSPIEFVHLSGNFALMMDCIQRAYTDDGNGDGRITPAGLLCPMSCATSTRHSGSF